MEIDSVQKYLDIIEKLKHNYTYKETACQNILFSKQVNMPKFIFRGHGDHKNYKILPGIFRTHNPSHGVIATIYSQMEYNVLHDFISEACRYVKDVSVSDIPAWLEIAQHFGVPTRLLDFTENPLVALYFACSDLTDRQASVWIINEFAYNKIFFNEAVTVSAEISQRRITGIITDEIVYCNPQTHDSPSYIQYPWIYKPCYREERMNLQSSVFMLWGARRQELTSFMESKYFMSDENDIKNQEYGVICNILIPGDRKRELLEQLNLCGINEKLIYPGLDGVGRFIKQKYSDKRLK